MDKETTETLIVAVVAVVFLIAMIGFAYLGFKGAYLAYKNGYPNHYYRDALISAGISLLFIIGLGYWAFTVVRRSRGSGKA